MQFKINSDKLLAIIKKIKTLKACDKSDESLSSMLIKTTNNKSNPLYPTSEYTITLTVMNNAFWCSLTLTDEDFSEYEVNNWGVSEEGKVFVNGSDFSEIVSAIPKNVVLEFQVKALNKVKATGMFLSTKYVENKKKVSLDFALTKPKFFDEEPIQENRRICKTLGSSFIEATKSVAFASEALTSEDLTDPFLWGCSIEINDDVISAAATNRKRICFYDKIGPNKTIDFSFNPISNFLLPVIAVMEDGDVEFEVGNKTTIIKQNKCVYVIPNVSEPEKFPNWRSVHSKVKSLHKAKISFSKQNLASSLKMVGLASGRKMGVRIDLDTSKKTLGFATQVVDDGGFMKAIYEESSTVNDDQIIWTEDNQPVMESVLLNIEFLKDICDTFSKDEDIIINFGANNSPIIVEGTQSFHKYILTSLEVGHKK